MARQIVINISLFFRSPYEYEWYKDWVGALKNFTTIASTKKKDKEHIFWFKVSGKGFVIWISDPQNVKKGIKIIGSKHMPVEGNELVQQIIEATEITLKQNNGYCEIIREEIETN